MDVRKASLLAIFDAKQRLEVPFSNGNTFGARSSQWLPLWEDTERKFVEALEGRKDTPKAFPRGDGFSIKSASLARDRFGAETVDEALMVREFWAPGLAHAAMNASNGSVSRIAEVEALRNGWNFGERHLHGGMVVDEERSHSHPGIQIKPLRRNCVRRWPS